MVQRSAIDIIGPDPESSSGILYPSRDDEKLCATGSRPMNAHFVLVVLGAGSSGLAAAKRGAGYGACEAIVEGDRVGGIRFSKVSSHIGVPANRGPKG